MPGGPEGLVPSGPPGASGAGVAGYVSVTGIRKILHFLSRNWIFSLACTAGLALRIFTALGFPPAIWYGGDSSSYLSSAVYLRPATSRLSGYGIYLYLLSPFRSFAVVTAVTHLMGLAAGVMIYALLRRYRLPRWGATLATLPVLLDAYQIELEHEILASATFGFLVIAAVTLVLWWPRQRPLWATATAGLALGLAATTWPVGIPVIILLLAYLVIRRSGWRAIVAAAVAAALPLGLYVDWFDSNYHHATMNYADGIFLYSRTMTFANCAIIKPPPDLAPLCTKIPIRERPTANDWIWGPQTPLDQIPGQKFSPAKNSLARAFAERAIEAQPFSYARDVFDDFWLTFSWTRPHHPSVRLVDRYQFAFANQNWIKPGLSTRRLDQVQRLYTGGSLGTTRIVEPFAAIMRGYQRYVYLRGTILLLLLITGLGGIARALAGGWQRRRHSREDREDSRASRGEWGGPALFPWVVGLAMLLVPPATADYSDRYVVPAAPVVCLAAALAFARLTRAGRQARRDLPTAEAVLSPGPAVTVPPQASDTEPAASPRPALNDGPSRQTVTVPAQAADPDAGAATQAGGAAGAATAASETGARVPRQPG
jgi:hypothetical protein